MESLQNTLALPLRAAVSKPAQRAYLRSALLFSVSSVLLVLAVLSYILFYASYIPSLSTVRSLHLQFPSPLSAQQHPYARTTLAPELVAGQPYDITLLLTLPASPANVERGNFMLDLQVMAAATPQIKNPKPLLYARRPAIMTYHSPLLHTMKTLLGAPLLLPGAWRQEETLAVEMAAGAVFTAAPAEAHVVIDYGITVYSASLRFDARFEGLRYVMFHHRIATFVGGVALFWAVEMLWALALWWYVAVRLAGRDEGPGAEMGTESDDDGDGGLDEMDRDVQRTFPTSLGQRPIRMPEYAYPSPRATPETETVATPESTIGEEVEAEADDEEDDEDEVLVEGVGVGGVTDSGIGTMSESAGSSSAAWRSGRDGGMPRRRSRGRSG